MKEWRPPPKNHLPDFRPLEGLLEYGDEVVRVVPVRLIVGSSVGAYRWNRDWTLDENVIQDDPRLLAYHREKLSRLMVGWPKRGWPPITEQEMLQSENYRDLHLYELEGVYFVASGGIHRVAVAHQKGFSHLRAVVSPASLLPDAPEEARQWVSSLKPPSR